MDSPSALLKMHDAIVVLYMLAMKPVNQSCNSFLRTEESMP